MDSNAKEAYEIAVRLLARREHSRHELRGKLRLRGVHSREIETVIEKLSESGLQSDDRFIENSIRSQLRKGHGPLKIRAYLLNRGIQYSKISKHLSNSDDYWFKRALESDAKCRVRNQMSEDNASNHESLQVRARYLTNRGYPANVISLVLSSPINRTNN
ncbi:MAG: regulatory protein RecX [Gammaproteobacteria bacterium]|nr:regulatory protein RecX [Gammaproteobacteria bacterium]